MVRNISKMSGILFNQPLSYCERDSGSIVRDHKEVQVVDSCRSLFDKVIMSYGKRIGIHHNSTYSAWMHSGFLQCDKVFFKTVLFVFQKDKCIRNRNARIKPESFKERSGFPLCIDKKVEKSVLISVCNQF